jgi:hypothetical protein
LRPRIPTAAAGGAALVLASVLNAAFYAAALAPEPREKSVWNYDGGIVLITDGSFQDGPCFRLSGRVNAPGFFDNLKRFDRDDSETVFRRGSETVTQFPDQVTLAFVVYDHPCSTNIEPASPHGYLTRPMMGSLHLYLYWKHGVELRAINHVEPKYFSVDPVTTRPVGKVSALREKLEWSYEFAIPSTGVPLTDSLVLVLKDADGRIAARVAARM